jgi:hypothetical protein
VQEPPLQTKGHAAPLFCQVPLVSQTCGCGPLQPSALGAHEPAQAPPLQAAVVQAAPLFCQTPVASQICGCELLHCFCPGLHTPVHAPVALSQT